MMILVLLTGVLLGTLVGVLASFLLQDRQGMRANIAAGILGSFSASLFTSLLGIGSFTFSYLVFGVGGAVGLLLIVRLARGSLGQPKTPMRAPSQPASSPAARAKDANSFASQLARSFSNQVARASGSRTVPPLQHVLFIGESNSHEQTVTIGLDEVPLDNRFGSNVLVSEHEFSRRESRTIKLERSRATELGLQAGIWSILEAEARGTLAQMIGIDLQQEEARRVMLRFEAAPGKMVLYRVIWKQTRRTGEAQLQVDGSVVSLPYVATYGLSHSVESVLQQG